MRSYKGYLVADLLCGDPLILYTPEWHIAAGYILKSNTSLGRLALLGERKEDMLTPAGWDLLYAEDNRLDRNHEGEIVRISQQGEARFGPAKFDRLMNVPRSEREACINTVRFANSPVYLVLRNKVGGSHEYWYSVVQEGLVIEKGYRTLDEFAQAVEHVSCEYNITFGKTIDDKSYLIAEEEDEWWMIKDPYELAYVVYPAYDGEVPEETTYGDPFGVYSTKEKARKAIIEFMERTHCWNEDTMLKIEAFKKDESL